MKQQLIQYTFLFLLILVTNTANAQSGMDFMQSIGKIYVVVAVILVVFTGIVLYLFRLDKKISRLEEQMEH